MDQSKSESFLSQISTAARSVKFRHSSLGITSNQSEWGHEYDPKRMVALHGTEINIAPIAPVIRPGHFEFTPHSLLPNQDSSIINDSVPRHELEKSSSSFLRDLQSPPSTASEDEAGKLGCRECLCLGKKVHWVDPMFKQRGEADKFAAVLLFFAIFSYVPALVGTLFYFVSESFREKLLEHYNACFCLVATMMLVYLILNYVSGVARHYPYDIVMIITKSICFGIGYTLAAPCVEYLWIRVRIIQDTRFEHKSDNEDLVMELYEEYVMNTEEGYDIDGIMPHHPIHLFLVAICYVLIVEIATFIAVIFTKLSIFGALYPMITYALTFFMVLVGATMTVDKAFDLFVEDHILWDLGQIILGPVLGLHFTDHFVFFLENVLNGKICPLKNDEFLYAMAHY